MDGWLDLAWFIIWALVILMGSGIIAVAAWILFLIGAFNVAARKMRREFDRRHDD